MKAKASGHEMFSSPRGKWSMGLNDQMHNCNSDSGSLLVTLLVVYPKVTHDGRTCKQKFLLGYLVKLSAQPVLRVWVVSNVDEIKPSGTSTNNQTSLCKSSFWGFAEICSGSSKNFERICEMFTNNSNKSLSGRFVVAYLNSHNLARENPLRVEGSGGSAAGVPRRLCICLQNTLQCHVML